MDRHPWGKAAFLHERSVPEGGTPPTPEVLQRAEARRQAWSKSMLSTEECFGERLQSAGLDGASFVQVIADGAARDESLAWLPLMGELLADRNAHVALPARAVSQESQRLRVPSFTRRFLQVGLARLRAGVAALSSRHGLPAALGPGVEGDLLEALELRVLFHATRVLVLELNVARMLGTLRGDTPEARFQDFTHRHYEDAATFAALLREYPVLARLLATSFERWLETSLELLERVMVDRARLGQVFLDGGDVGELTEVRTGLGDVHRRGRSVALVTFGSGLGLAYKPRSLEIESRYQDLLRWLKERGLRHAHRELKVLDRGEYGWVEQVRPAGCDSREAVARFYWRQGSHLALLYLLRAVDFHFGNLLAVGEHPVLVDLEGLFHHRPEFVSGDSALHKAMGVLDRSVLTIGLLPTLLFGREGKAGVDVSGLGGEAGQLYPHNSSTVEDRFRDTMRVVRKQVATTGANNRPTVDGKPVDTTDFVDDIVGGFEETYALMARHRDALRAVLTGFAEVEVRHIARPTMRYGFLLNESHHPDFLRDALDRDQVLDKLWAEASQRPGLRRLVPSEHEDLRLGDIPVFSARPGHRHAWDSRGRCIPDYFPAASLDESLQLLESLGEAGCQAQVAMIRQSMVAISKDRESRVGAKLPVIPDLPAATAEECLAAAVGLGEHLAASAIQGDTDACWIGVSLQDMENWRWSLSPIGTSTYDGVGGVALFFGYLAAVTGREDFRALARKALEPVRRQWKEPDALDSPGVGALSGRGSHVYVLGHLSVLLDAPELLEEAFAGFPALEEKIVADKALDIASGVAGCALVLVGLYRLTGDARALALARRCGERMLESATPKGGGLAWVVPASNRELAGMSHGATGFAWSLLELASVTGDTRYREAALQALVFERTVFVPEHGNWRDLRTSREGEPVVPGALLTAWCNGAAGIALGRALMLRHVDTEEVRRELDIGLRTIVRTGFGGGHSLCHGDVGNLEVLDVAGDALGDASWKRAAREHAAQVLHYGRRGEWRCGVPQFNEAPGLMLGLSGIGLGLLRLAVPSLVPSVLSLEPPRARRA